MVRGEKLPPQVLKALAAKAAEALDILKLIGPLCKKPGALTESQAAVLVEAIRNADAALSEAMQLYYAAWQADYEVRQAKKKAVAPDKGNGLFKE